MQSVSCRVNCGIEDACCARSWTRRSCWVLLLYTCCRLVNIHYWVIRLVYTDFLCTFLYCSAFFLVRLVGTLTQPGWLLHWSHRCWHFRCRCISCLVSFMTTTKICTTTLRWTRSLRHCMLHRGFLPSLRRNFQSALLLAFSVCLTAHFCVVFLCVM